MASNEEREVVTMAKLESLFQKFVEGLFQKFEAKMDQRFAEMSAKFDARFVEKETVMEETNIEVNRMELSSENHEMKSISGTPTTKNYECEEIINVDISEHEVIEEQSDLEIVNDIEVDWDEDIVFDHSTIESKPIITEQQLTGVKCLFLPTKYSSESLVSTTQQEANAMKYEATDVEVSSANVLKVETESNSFAQFEVGLPRKIWDPGLDNILL